MPIALISFHHFYSKRKLLHLRALADKYLTHGIYKRGRPGILLVSCKSFDTLLLYIGGVKKMHWQQCKLRGTSEDLNLRGTGLHEVPSGKMRDVILTARESGQDVEDWVKVKMGYIKG